MKKNALIVGTTMLLGSLLATPMAFADHDGDWHIMKSEWRWHKHHHDHNKIEYLRARLERSRVERQRVEWAYNQARRVGDWPTVRYEQARLDRLDREIRHDQHELHRAYEQARWDRYRHDDWRGEYGYEYNRY